MRYSWRWRVARVERAHDPAHCFATTSVQATVRPSASATRSTVANPSPTSSRSVYPHHIQVFYFHVQYISYSLCFTFHHLGPSYPYSVIRTANEFVILLSSINLLSATGRLLAEKNVSRFELTT